MHVGLSWDKQRQDHGTPNGSDTLWGVESISKTKTNSFRNHWGGSCRH